MARKLLLILMLLSGALAQAGTVGTQGLFKFYNDLANQGDPESMYILANMYNEGRGTRQDLEEALKWYKKAADHGIVQAAQKVNEVALKIRNEKNQEKTQEKPRTKDTGTVPAVASPTPPGDGLERTIIFEQREDPGQGQSQSDIRQATRQPEQKVIEEDPLPKTAPDTPSTTGSVPAAGNAEPVQAVPVVPVQITPVPVTPRLTTGAGQPSAATDKNVQTGAPTTMGDSQPLANSGGAASVSSGNELHDLEQQLKRAEAEAEVAKENEMINKQVQLLKEQVESLKMQAERAYREAHTARQREAQYAKEKAEIEQQHEKLLEKVEEMQDGLKYSGEEGEEKPKEVEFKANPCTSPAARFMSTCK